MTAATPGPQRATVDQATATTHRRKLAAVLLSALGLMIVFSAGFAPGEVVHNAAHDSRHSFAFPCH